MTPHNPTHARLRAPAPLPRLRTTDAEAKAAWVTGWWAGKVTGFVLGLGAAVLIGVLR